MNDIYAADIEKAVKQKRPYPKHLEKVTWGKHYYDALITHNVESLHHMLYLPKVTKLSEVFSELTIREHGAPKKRGWFHLSTIRLKHKLSDSTGWKEKKFFHIWARENHDLWNDISFVWCQPVNYELITGDREGMHLLVGTGEHGIGNPWIALIHDIDLVPTENI